MRSGSLCALFWRLLSWCHPRGIVLRARHIPGRLNVIADKLSRHNQVIQTEWSLDQRVFNLLCSNWGLPQVDLFATHFNFKIPRFVSPVPDRKAWAVDALSQPWEDLEVYAFPPVSLLNLVVSKVVDQGCRRMILIAPGWPNMPWFWDLVNLSVQVPFQLPLHQNLITQPFNGLIHRNLSNLNLHAWFLDPVSSRSKGSLTRWQQELRLLRDAQPEPYTSKSGPFLLNGATRIRWTSGRLLSVKQQTFSCTYSRTEICNLAPSMDIGLPLRIWSVMISSTSVRTRILLVFWIVFIGTNQRADEKYPFLEPFLGPSSVDEGSL